jgi:uncharacterized protein with PQ loop repeat
MFETLAVIASVCLPLTNIPLIVKIIQRKSSKDISMYWAWGVWLCLLVMVPAATQSVDLIWKIFALANFATFSVVLFFTMLYRKGPAQ